VLKAFEKEYQFQYNLSPVIETLVHS